MSFPAARDVELWKTPLLGLPRKQLASGYMMVRVVPGMWENEHRMVLAQMLGRPLALGETAHHRNGNRADNRPENLELWINSRGGQRHSEQVSCPHCGAGLELTAIAPALRQAAKEMAR